jgi:hypothetical protein
MEQADLQKALSTACPVCAQQPGEPCRSSRLFVVELLETPHAERLAMAYSNAGIQGGEAGDYTPTKEQFDHAVEVAL